VLSIIDTEDDGTGLAGWSLYLIRTDAGSLYCGVTTDVERRFHEHSSSGIKAAKSLRGRGPLTLEFQRYIGSRSAALKCEFAVKRLSRNEKEKLISGLRNLPEIVDASEA
jgi:putative endonuclease|tara:strand:+ start:1983 stop:2312 length:330 start_codon:yes stop_codon:yes gene_type:complete